MSGLRVGVGLSHTLKGRGGRSRVFPSADERHRQARVGLGAVPSPSGQGGRSRGHMTADTRAEHPPDEPALTPRGEGEWILPAWISAVHTNAPNQTILARCASHQSAATGEYAEPRMTAPESSPSVKWPSS